MRTYRRYIEVQNTLAAFHRHGCPSQVEDHYQRRLDALWLQMSGTEKQLAIRWARGLTN